MHAAIQCEMSKGLSHHLHVFLWSSSEFTSTASDSDVTLVDNFNCLLSFILAFTNASYVSNLFLFVGIPFSHFLSLQTPRIVSYEKLHLPLLSYMITVVFQKANHCSKPHLVPTHWWAKFPILFGVEIAVNCRGESVILRTDFLPLINAMNNDGFMGRFHDDYLKLKKEARELPKGVQFEHVFAHEGEIGNEKVSQFAFCNPNRLTTNIFHAAAQMIAWE